ncbi:MAG: hypothetical protein K6G64_00260 [Eubacterium sp.]|nr:hypothetical protein [Eubacterium sp.]
MLPAEQIIYSLQMICLEIIDGRTITIGLYGQRPHVADELILTICHYCRNAKTGSTEEMEQYVKRIRSGK